MMFDSQQRDCRGGLHVVPFLLLAVTLGCGSQPIPLVAVEGTTISLAIPGNFPTGFGRTYSGVVQPASIPTFGSSPRPEDPQNGELFFVLYDELDNPLTQLPLRYITRVNPSPSSQAAFDPNLNTTYYSRGQTLAFVDIPVGATPADGDYKIKVSRARRKPGSEDPSNTFEILPAPLAGDGSTWSGWGDDGVPQGVAGSADSIAIHILKHDGVERFTPLKTWENSAGIGVTWANQGFAQLKPYPEFEVRVPAIGSQDPPPAAWEIQYVYPRDRIRIRGVNLRRAAHSQAMVRWNVEFPDEGVACGAIIPGLVTIRVIDPDQLTEGIRIAYELTNFEQPCGARATATDFVENPNSFNAYDADGNVLTGYSAEIDTSWFF